MRIAPRSDLGGERYRTVREPEIIGTLLIAGQAYDLGSGRRSNAETETAAALEAWVKAGLGFAVSDNGERLFDPVEVINYMKWTGLKDLDDFWPKHIVATSRAFTQKLLGDQRHVFGFGPAPARFCFTLQRKVGLSQISNRSKVRIRLPLPLAEFSNDLEVKILPSDHQAIRVENSDGRLEFQFAAPLEPFIELAAEMSFTTTGRSNVREAFPITAPIENYLRQTEGLIKITPRVRDLAQSLGGKNQSWDAAMRCWNFVLDELCCGMVRYDQVDQAAPGDWVLDNGWYDCHLGASLFIAMCRARGIPARLLSGYVLYKQAPGFHYWAEIWSPGRGWLPFDFLSWDLSTGGRDQYWRQYFAGKIEYRMVTQCFPLAFTGPMSVRFPQAWHLINAPADGGMQITFTELNGSLIYRDRTSVRTFDN